MAMSRAIDFSADAYRRLVRGFLDHGYETRFFDDFNRDDAHLLLRHDIDQCLQAAARLAEIEAEMGVSSTYFVLLRTEMYNPLSHDGTAAIRGIADLGHRIGLHFDPSLYPDDRDAYEAAAVRECTILESLLEGPVGVISFHRPAPSLLGLPGRLAGRLHAYAQAFFSDIAYCSDSTGQWRHGHPFDHADFGENRAMQLLTHPVWWMSPGNAPAEKLRTVLDGRVERLDRELAENCRPWREMSKRRGKR